MSSKSNMEFDLLKLKNVSRRMLWTSVAKKLSGKVNRQKTLNIISFLLDFLLEEIKNGSQISIGNFCKLHLVKMRQRRYIDIYTNQYKISSGLKSLRFKLDKKLSRTLIDSLDCEETFRETNEQEIYSKNKDAP